VPCLYLYIVARSRFILSFLLSLCFAFPSFPFSFLLSFILLLSRFPLFLLSFLTSLLPHFLFLSFLLSFKNWLYQTSERHSLEKAIPILAA
jgi:hypothetical protein